MTGPCIQGQCLAGLQCFVDECVPGAGSNSNSNSNGNSDGDPEDPTTTSGTTGVSGGVSESSMTQATTASSNDPGPTTGDASTTSTTTNVTNVTNPMTTGVERTTGVETDTWDDSASDSQNFITPDTDTGDDPCGGINCGVGETCVLVGDEPQCLMHCHPLDPEYCGTGNVCVQNIDVFVCAPDASGDVGAVGQGCAYTNGCDPGLACLDGQWVAGCNGQYCCTPFCDLSLADPCLAYDMQCVGWWEQGMAPQGFEDVGVCAVV